MTFVCQPCLELFPQFQSLQSNQTNSDESKENICTICIGFRNDEQIVSNMASFIKSQGFQMARKRVLFSFSTSAAMQVRFAAFYLMATSDKDEFHEQTEKNWTLLQRNMLRGFFCAKLSNLIGVEFIADPSDENIDVEIDCSLVCGYKDRIESKIALSFQTDNKPSSKKKSQNYRRDHQNYQNSKNEKIDTTDILTTSAVKRKRSFDEQTQTSEKPYHLLLSDDKMNHFADLALSVQRALQNVWRDTSAQDELKDWFRSGLAPISPFELNWRIKITRKPQIMFGRYLKLSRDVPQSPWFLHGDQNNRENDDEDSNRKGYFSVHEIIAEKVVKYLFPLPDELSGTKSENQFDEHSSKISHVTNTQAEKDAKYLKIICDENFVNFHGAGREDIDVRMLGNGRPFVLQVKNAKVGLNNEDMPMLQDLINAKTGMNVTEFIKISGLQLVNQKIYQMIQNGAEEKKKTYTCVIWVKKSITPQDLMILESAQDLVLIQKTPIRVLHRRTLMEREKIIHHMQCKYINDHFFQLSVQTSAGTYVKEFVHGDFGRTVPSIASLLGCPADILQLDVTEINDDFMSLDALPFDQK